MSGDNKTRILLVSGAVILTVLIYLAPKTPHKKKSEVDLPAEIPEFSFADYREDSRNVLGWSDGQKVDSFLVIASSSDPSYYDSIASVFDRSGNPAAAAYYFEEKSSADPTEQSYLNAAYRYFDAYKAATDSAEVAFFVNKAIANYEKVIEINPANLNAKTDLGVCITEGTGQPMRGITLLREVVEEDPYHEYAQMNLGYLSMKSGQYEKAIGRFEKVIEINPVRLDMYVYMGEAYIQLGKNTEAIECFRSFTALSNDAELVEQVNEYIKMLENNGAGQNNGQPG